MKQQTKPEYPKILARFYDIVYDVIRASDEQFYLQLIKHTPGPVLEIGVGTGRLFTKALYAGADIYGIDNSAPMLDILQGKLPNDELFRLLTGDVTTFNFTQKFGLVIAPFRFISHFITVQDQIRLLSNIYTALRSDGVLVFDVIAPRTLILNAPVEKKKLDFQGEWKRGKFLHRYSKVDTDLFNQVQTVTIQYEWEITTGEVKTYEWELKSRYFHLFELQHLLARTGFKVEKIFGDYQKSPLSQKSSDFVILCKKV